MTGSEIVEASREKAMQLEIELSSQSLNPGPPVEPVVPEEPVVEPVEEAAVVDPVAETEPAEPVVEQFDPKFETLKRREKALREREQGLKETQTKYEDWEAAQALAKTDPVAYLEKVGITYDAITQSILNGGPTPEEKSPQVSELEARLAKFENAREQENMQKLLDSFHNELDTHLTSNAEEYELINATKSQQLVSDTIRDHYVTYKEELSIDEACKAVEEALWATEVERAQRLITVGKMREKLGLGQVNIPEELPTAEVKKPTQTKTLSNTKTAAPTKVAGGAPTTLKDSIVRAKLLEEEFKRKT